MKTKFEEPEKMVKVPESGLLPLVASKLEGRILFPVKVEYAKKLVKNIILKLT